MDDVFLRVKREIRNLKQSKQRSSATIITKSVNFSAAISVTPGELSSSGYKVFHVKNLSNVPTIFDVTIRTEALRQILPANGRVYYVQWVDKDDPLSYYVYISAVIYRASLTTTYTLPLTITATVDFIVEEA